MIIGSQELYLYLCVYIAVIFGGGYFVQKVTRYFMNQIDKSLLQNLSVFSLKVAALRHQFMQPELAAPVRPPNHKHQEQTIEPAALCSL